MSDWNIYKVSPKPKIAIVVASVFQIKFFLEPHLALLTQHYDVTVVLNNDQPQIFKLIKFTGQFKFIHIQRKISLFKDFYTLLELIIYFHQQNFNLVHTMNPKAGLLAGIAAYFCRVPKRIHTFQGEIWSNKKGFIKWFFLKIDTLIAALCTHILVVSPSEKQYLESYGVFPRDMAIVLGHGSIGGVNINRFKPDSQITFQERSLRGYTDENIVFLYLGRLTADKGVFNLAEAFKRVVVEKPYARLLFVGPDEGGNLEKIKLMLSEHKRSVEFQPYTSTAENVIRAADVLVLPSYREGFGVVIIEASACGVCSIGSNIYGIQDAIVDGETGMVFEVGNTVDLIGKMLTLCEDTNLRLRLGEKAMKRVADMFNSDNVLSEFMVFYQEIIKT